MKKVKINIGDKDYIVKVAETEEQQQEGLQDIKELPKDEGMLFIWEKPEEISMWMKDTKIPLDLVFMDSDFNVLDIFEGVPESEDYLTVDDTSAVLEVNKDSGIKKDDILEFIGGTVKSGKMLVLKEDGTPQMELEGGERIFSRPNTKILIKFSKRAYATKQDKDYKALGKRIFKFLDMQDSNEPEYVENK
ncbi:MAG: DUF192 domain-containing protein [Candidatus Woesearchaeota archaeon]|jgi:uncharacterized membrane protein (UPF0127 family)|nr:DUF192 domain-containing protein [Candidatus Woesearchaeota archaeon]